MTEIGKAKERTRFFRFATVGAIGSAIDIGVMNLLTQVFNFPLVLGGSVSKRQLAGS